MATLGDGTVVTLEGISEMLQTYVQRYMAINRGGYDEGLWDPICYESTLTEAAIGWLEGMADYLRDCDAQGVSIKQWLINQALEGD